MAITFQSAGTPSAVTPSPTPSYPTSIAAGDLLWLLVVNKYPTNGPSTPSGWTFYAQTSGGQGSSGADSGNVYVTLYYRIADGTETGTFTVTITGANSSRAQVTRWSKGAGETWGLSSPSTATFAAGTAVSFTGSIDPGAATGDQIAVFGGANTNAFSLSSPKLTLPGTVIGDPGGPFQESAGANGDHIRIWGSQHGVTSGVSSGAPAFTATYSGTSGNSPAGAAIIVRMSVRGAIASSTGKLLTTSTATLRGAGKLASATGKLITPSTATLRGAGALASSTGKLLTTSTSTLRGAGKLAGSATTLSTSTATLRGAGKLASSTGKLLTTSAATLRGAGKLAGSATTLSASAATLRGAGRLAGSATTLTTSAATLRGAGKLAASSPLLSATGTLRGDTSLSGSANLLTTSTATLRGAGSLSGSALTLSTSAATLRGAGKLAAAAPLLSLTGTLNGAGALAGSTDILTYSATLRGDGALSGFAVLLTATGTLRRPRVSISCVLGKAHLGQCRLGGITEPVVGALVKILDDATVAAAGEAHNIIVVFDRPRMRCGIQEDDPMRTPYTRPLEARDPNKTKTGPGTSVT